MAEDTESRVQMFLGAIAIIGGGLLMLLEKSLFASRKFGFIRTLPFERQDYAEEVFTPAGLIVFFISATCAILWYLTALKWSVRFDPTKDTTPARLRWVLFSFFPILSVIGVVWFWGSASAAAQLWLLVFLIVDIVIIYWLSTALSTPDNMLHVVPLATLLRG